FDPQSSSPHPCFYNLRKSPVCTVDGQFLIVISRNLTRPALNLSSLYVKDGQEAECKPKLTTTQFVTFHFPITSCGSSKREEDGSMVYETDVLGKRMIQTGKLGSVTRDSTFRCPYEGDDYLTLLHPVGVFSGLEFPTHHKRFEVKTFVFLDGKLEQPLSRK
ncbi:hypothetical protein scyTo_0014898, partial [Scyliorhinus torazame]|nr:hypothetical protein [Scyliorhinus torazame]